MYVVELSLKLSPMPVAVQIYEKSAAGSGGKRPGFSFDS